MSTPSPFWDRPSPGETVSPPVAQAQIDDWEARHGLRLPATLAAALREQDGGRVDGTEFWIDGLDDFSVLDDPRWDDHLDPENQEIEGLDRTRLLLIGDCYGCGVVLDYRQQGEPLVLLMHHNLGGVLRDEDCGTFDAFLATSRR